MRKQGRARASEKLSKRIRKSDNSKQLQNQYEALEKRQVLAALFPTWVDGQFTLGDPLAGTPYNLSDTFKLSSNPNALRTIYLDFDGQHSVNNAWGHDIIFPRYDRDGDTSGFITSELIEIQKIFQNVAEDFSPFDVNVTTTDPGLDKLTKSGVGDTTWGMRVIHTQATDGFGNGIGGVAFLNSFDDSTDNPCFAFNKGVINGAMTISHEVGHTLGLRHDGLDGAAYHPGTGSGPTGWGPIMGAPFGKNLSQWSKGEYVGANNLEDDYTIITKAANGLNFIADDAGDSIPTAAPLELTSGTEAFDWGFISQPTDVDYYRVDLGNGPFSLTINPFQENPNLDILAVLYDSDGNVVATSNPVDDVTASFNIPNIQQGRYYISIDGTGKDPVYTDYGSMGFYTMNATFVEPNFDPNQIGETGVIENLYDRWRTVNLTQQYANPVVVAGPATRRGGDPVTIRVRNVTTESFQIAVDEWDYRDGRHTYERVSYMVMEAGTYELADGTVIQAGLDATNHRWDDTTFNNPFVGEVPVVFTQVMTYNDPSAVTTRIRNVNETGFQYRVQEEEGNDRIHAVETVGWLAITRGTGSTDGKNFEAFVTPNAVTEADYSVNFVNSYAQSPVFLANMQTYNGGDPATVRLGNISNTSATFYLEEERSFDQETAHNPERVGYLAMDRGPVRWFPDGGSPAPMAMRAMGSAYYPFTKVTTNPAIIQAALLKIKSWGEDSSPLDHDSGNEGCPHGECMAMAAEHSETSGMLVSVLFGTTITRTEPVAARVTTPAVTSIGPVQSKLAGSTIGTIAVRNNSRFDQPAASSGNVKAADIAAIDWSFAKSFKI